MSEGQVGKLWVELELQAGKFMVNMDAAEERFEKTKEAAEKIGKTIEKVGAVMSAFGAVVVGSMAFATKSFANTGDALDEMSQRTGMTTKSLQELGYIASLSGGSIAEVEVGVKRMASVITDARNGVTGATDAIHDLGLKVSDLANLSPDEQFDKIAVALSGIENPTQRAALAIDLFGRSGTAMLPMLSGGEEGIKKLREQANLYAGVMSKDAVDAAVQFSDKMDNLTASLKSLWNEIGQNVVPLFTVLVDAIQPVLTATRDLIKEHSYLSTALAGVVFVIGVLSAGTGIALLAIGKLMKSFDDMRVILTKAVIPAVKALWTLIAAHPFIAITTAVAIATNALLGFLVARKDEQNANINTGKSLAQKIALMEEEKKKWKEIATSGKSSTEEQKAALEKYNAAAWASTEYQKQLNKQLIEDQAAKNAANAAADAAFLAKNKEYQNALVAYQLATQQISLADRAVFLQAQLAQTEENSAEYLKLKQDLYDNDLAIQAQHHINIQTAQDKLDNNIVTGWQGVMNNLSTSQTNWYQNFTELISKIQTGTAASFEKLFTDIGQGWKAFADFFKNIGNVILQALISQLAAMAAAQTIHLASKLAKEKAATAVSIKLSAAEGAAKAAAATAWTLWGAIAVGAAIGAAIMAFAGSFSQGGIVGGGSVSGDNMIAAVNSGEMILNRQQQANLFKIANGSGGGGSTQQTIIMQLDGQTIATATAKNLPNVLKLYGAI